MRKLGMYLAVVLSLVCVEEVNLQANPLPGCFSDECIIEKWQKKHPFRSTPSLEEIKKQNKEEQARRDESYKKKVAAWWTKNCSNGVKQPYVDSMRMLYNEYVGDVNELWLRYHPTERKYRFCVNCTDEFSVPFKKREKFYFDIEQKIYGTQVPYCLSQKTQDIFRSRKQKLPKEIEDYEKCILVREQRKHSAFSNVHARNELSKYRARWIAAEKLERIPSPTLEELNAQDREEIAQLRTELTVIQQAESSIPKIADKLGLSLQRPFNLLEEPSIPPEEEQRTTKEGKSFDLILPEGGFSLDTRDPCRTTLKDTSSVVYVDFPSEKTFQQRLGELAMKQEVYFLLLGLIVAGITAGAGLILLKRKKNLPK